MQMSGKRTPHPSPNNIGHDNHQKSLHTNTNDFLRIRALKSLYNKICNFQNSTELSHSVPKTLHEMIVCT